MVDINKIREALATIDRDNCYFVLENAPEWLAELCDEVEYLRAEIEAIREESLG